MGRININHTGSLKVTSTGWTIKSPRTKQQFQKDTEKHKKVEGIYILLQRKSPQTQFESNDCVTPVQASIKAWSKKSKLPKNFATNCTLHASLSSPHKAVPEWPLLWLAAHKTHWMCHSTTKETRGTMSRPPCEVPSRVCTNQMLKDKKEFYKRNALTATSGSLMSKSLQSPLANPSGSLLRLLTSCNAAHRKSQDCNPETICD